MFYFCYGLVGQNGTKYDSANKVTNHTYARIDTADTPGYFTYKAPPSSTSTSSSATEAQVTSLFNSVSNTAKASYNEFANATFQMIPYVNTVKDEPTTGNTGNTSGTIEYDTATLHIEPTKTGSTWTYEIPVHDADVLYYVWEETVPEGYTSDAKQNEPKEIPEATRQQTITNTKNPVDKGNLKLSKKVTKGGNPVTDDTTPFTFKITLSGDKITENQYFDAYEFIYDENSQKATAEIILKNNESVTIEGIPADTTYTIEETNVPYGYTSNLNNSSGTITKDTTESVEWENKADNRELSQFYVSKTVELYEVTKKLDGTQTDPEKKDTLPDTEKNQEFTFTAVLTNLGRSAEYTIKKGNETLKTFTSDTSGNAIVTFSLKHGEKADFEGIPIGATYQITETDVDGYKTSYSLTDTITPQVGSIVRASGESETGLETLDNNENVTVAFTNSKTVTVKETIETMDIEVEKQWAGDNELDRPKSITIYLERYLDGFPNNVETFDTVIITPHNSEWKTKFTNIPKTDEQGRTYIYSVREESVAGYTCSIANPFTDTTGNQTFTITNTKISTYDLTINKTVEGAFGNKAKQFEFTVTLTDNAGKPLNGFYTLKRGDTETLILFDVYGQTKIGVSHGEEAVIKNLPQGTIFTITETDYSKEGYTTNSGLSSNQTEKSLTVNGTLYSNTTVYFVNRRDGILPTGANLNVIPFALLGALSLGMILLIQRKKYKNFN